MKHIQTKLPNGNTLCVDYEDEFIDMIRGVYKIPADEQVTDDQIRMFIYEAMNNAVNKYEAETNAEK